LRDPLDARFAFERIGNYAQFHRVFRARLNVTPRQYLRPGGSGLRGAEQRR
jgi:hypothetical protein